MLERLTQINILNEHNIKNNSILDLANMTLRESLVHNLFSLPHWGIQKFSKSRHTA